MKTELLPCELTELERRERAHEVCLLNAKYLEIEEEKKAAVKNFDEELKEIRKEMNTLSATVKLGFENRVVEVIERFDWERGLVDIIRIDTHEVVRSREMTAPERQLPLSLQPSEVK